MLLAATGGFGGKSSAQTPLEWIDVHVHLLGGGGVRSDFAGAARAAIAAMDESGIRASVVMPPPQVDNQDPRGRHDIREFADSLMREFPGRFVLGGDQFIPAPSMTGAGPGLSFARLSPLQREMTRKFLSALPPETARQIAIENPMRLYKIGGAR